MNKNRVRRYELAKRLIVSPNTVTSWRIRYADFPQPIGRFYDLAAVQEWKQKHDAEKPNAGKSIPRSAS